jgi:hypothetical protein
MRRPAQVASPKRQVEATAGHPAPPALHAPAEGGKVTENVGTSDADSFAREDN